MIFENKGIDGNKRINGQKRQILVDSEGLIWSAVIHAANLADSIMGCLLLNTVIKELPEVEKILVDAGYRGLLVWPRIDWN